MTSSPPVDPTFDWTILDRYYAHELSPEDRVRLEAWLAGDASRQALLAALDEVHARYAGAPTSWDTQGVVEQILKRTAPAGGRVSGTAPPRRNVEQQQVGGQASWSGRGNVPGILRRQTWYTAAWAVLAVAVVLGIQHISTLRHGRRAGIPVSTYVTGNGERATITLPDGSTVSLNVASRLDVPADYLMGDHTLRLRGEALFTAQHHGGQPLTIIAGGATTRVLGTSFVVRHYPTDSGTTVAVRTGKVAVGNTVVTENQAVEVGQRGAARFRSAASSLFSFATGILTLDELDLPQAIPELNRWYDADIQLGDPSLAKRGIGGKFAAGSLAELAVNLELTLNVRVVRTGRVLTLYPE